MQLPHLGAKLFKFMEHWAVSKKMWPLDCPRGQTIRWYMKQALDVTLEVCCSLLAMSAIFTLFKMTVASLAASDI